jgi:hypothetical protein
MLKPSKLGSLGNGDEPLLGNGTWKHTNPTPSVNRSDNVFWMREQNLPDHLNWRGRGRGRGRKQLHISHNGFNSMPRKDAPPISRTAPAARRMGSGSNESPSSGNATPRSHKEIQTSRSCRTYMLVLCLITSLAFNAVLIVIFIREQ